MFTSHKRICQVKTNGSLKKKVRTNAEMPLYNLMDHLPSKAGINTGSYQHQMRSGQDCNLQTQT